MKIVNVVGARPNFMKMAPIITALNTHPQVFHQTLVHTGQHYDDEMSKVFFEDLGMPKPDINLGVGSGSHAEQTGQIMVEFEKICEQENPDLIIVVGDVNSTLACSIVAKKLNIKVAHVEAGLRSRDMSMPEEINRIVTDAIADILFVTEQSGIENLKMEGRSESDIIFVGNVMVDTLYLQLEKLRDQNKTKAKSKNGSAVVTLHRPANVDDRKTFEGILDALIHISKDLEVIFPIHPRTKKSMEVLGLAGKVKGHNFRLLPPLPYNLFLGIWKDARLVLTDSGGLQEETTALGIPCFTIRENTERPITIEKGTNTLVGNSKQGILSAYQQFKNGKSKSGRVPDLWDGKAAERIAAHLARLA